MTPFPPELQTRYQSLPNELKEAIESSSYETILQAIAREHRLHIDQTGLLADSILRLLFGLTTAEEFLKVLQQQGSMSEDDAAAILEDVHKKILLPVEEALHDIIVSEGDVAQEVVFEEPRTVHGLSPTGVGALVNDDLKEELPQDDDHVQQTTPATDGVQEHMKHLIGETEAPPPAAEEVEQITSPYSGADPYREPPV